MADQVSLSVIIPTLNAAAELPDLLTRLKEQKGVDPEIIVIDSSSVDATQDIAKEFGARICVIERQRFDHGGTRTEAARIAGGDILVFMTQDAIPADSSALGKLIASFDRDPRIVAAYGRQLPKPDANVFGEHLRLFNYPETSHIRCFEDRHSYGFKTAFISNSFAAYRKKVLEDVGFFEEGLLFGEDAYTLAKLLVNGFCVAYAADACVLHSHNYSIWQDFKRYFDVGVFHADNQDLLEKFGTPTAEGRRYVQSELSSLVQKKKYWLLPESCLRNFAKFLAYNLGKRYTLIPGRLAMKLSMNRRWWKNIVR